MDPTAYKSNYNYTAPTGGGDVKGFNPNFTDTFNKQNTNSQNFFGGQLGNVGAFQGAYQAATNALPTYQKLYTDASNDYNVPTLAGNAARLQNTVSQIPQTYSAATLGSDTNNNQLMQLIGQKQWELAPLAQAATNEAQTAEGLASTKAGYGIQNENFLTQPFQTAAPMVTNVLASQATGFNQQNANELAALEAKMASGVTLTTDEQDNLNRLQVAKQQYDQAVKTAQISAQASQNVATIGAQNQVLGAGSTYYNPITGKAYNPFATPGRG